MKKYGIINETVWVQRNGRPNVATRRLQASHQNILWIAKDDRRYRFNYRLCKRSDYGDWLSKRNQQLRDIWDIRPTATRTKPIGIRHQTASPLSKHLGVSGRPGRLLLDLFWGVGKAPLQRRCGGWVISIEGRRPAAVMAARRRQGATKLAHGFLFI